jgi:hypothetical protein
VRKGQGHHVADFVELATRVAELHFRKRDHVFLFRGQRSDHRNRLRNTSLNGTVCGTMPGSAGAAPHGAGDGYGARHARTRVVPVARGAARAAVPQRRVSICRVAPRRR